MSDDDRFAQRREHRQRLQRHRDQRRHPVTQILKGAASGSLPTQGELDALALSPAARRTVRDVASAIHAHKLAGENQHAQELADQHAGEIIAALPEEQRDPDYTRAPEPDTFNYDPKALAAGVTRW